MPWKECKPMDERLRLVGKDDYLSGRVGSWSSDIDIALRLNRARWIDRTRFDINSTTESPRSSG
jgi:hypothetical protein